MFDWPLLRIPGEHLTAYRTFIYTFMMVQIEHGQWLCRLLHLSFFFFVLLEICHAGNVLHSPNRFYSDHENCLIRLARDTVDLSEAQNDLITNYNQTACSGLSTSIGDVDVPFDCFLGSGHHSVRRSAVIATTAPFGAFRCRARAIFERQTLLSHVDSERNPVTEFIHMIDRSNFSNMYFIGDSISVQLTHFIGCDLMRHGLHLNDIEGYSKLSFGHYRGGAGSFRSHGQKKNISIYSLFALSECVYYLSPCENVARGVADYFTKKLHPLLSADNNLVVLNIGLHWHFTDTNFTEKVEAFADGLLHLAKTVSQESKGSVLAFRETTAQHFGLSDNGYFEDKNVSYLTEESLCCESHRDGIQNVLDYRDRIVLDRLKQIDPNWNRYLVWIKLFQYTQLTGEDMHVECGKSYPDCSHWIYDPDPTGSITGTLLENIARAVARHKML